MLGKVTERGSFRRRSVVMTAGSEREMVSRLAVDFAGDLHLVAGDFDLAGEGGLREIREGRQHLAGLVGVVVDRLLAEDHQLGLLLVDQPSPMSAASIPALTLLTMPSTQQSPGQGI